MISEVKQTFSRKCRKKLANNASFVKEDNNNKKQLYVAADILNVRKKPEKDSRIVKLLHKGWQITIYKTIGKWASISEKNDRLVSIKFLSKKTPE